MKTLLQYSRLHFDEVREGLEAVSVPLVVGQKVVGYLVQRDHKRFQFRYFFFVNRQYIPRKGLNPSAFDFVVFMLESFLEDRVELRALPREHFGAVAEEVLKNEKPRCDTLRVGIFQK